MGTVTRSTRHTRARARLSRLATDGMDVAIVKLGGAALTVKSRRGTIDARGFEDCVETVARARARGTGRASSSRTAPDRSDTVRGVNG